MFLRYSSEVQIYKIYDNKFQDLVYRTKIETEYINDITFSENNIFVCFDNATVARIYPNDGGSENDNGEEEEQGFNEDPMDQVE